MTGFRVGEGKMKILPDFSDWIELPDAAVSGVTRKIWLTKKTESGIQRGLFKFGDGVCLLSRLLKFNPLNSKLY
ncbi:MULTISPECIES: hypothetical protein [unclassified Paenibacillus]|uniref:hypothetical protein n=1 Tax=unclassified Paenibacillus TaxID=185978 RepID=UPI0024055A95|nr:MULTISPECIES: hypothetical protein [unclassified Paenibacillus]MDF9844252.1 hypothetical protein [Paenibacillus sp. PastF-2]MDF9850856.1 hypothetical protein [Paenibacillus sp. PastM-2]MDF9857380.1 hypothetical protein [Paenibacillus sp. PastF-1]MDH6482648.1 hypothetical protein [Paenibacillus sp. PastH-2]MDH6510121.1 hypothetical protein [Paenibacillus sp. PastM-3]